MAVPVKSVEVLMEVESLASWQPIRYILVRLCAFPRSRQLDEI
jgi:hypothetical protein